MHNKNESEVSSIASTTPEKQEGGIDRRRLLKSVAFFSAGVFADRMVYGKHSGITSIIKYLDPANDASIDKKEPEVPDFEKEGPEVLYFESVQAYNKYVERKERKKDWSERDAEDPFGEAFKAERENLRKETGGNTRRTLGFVVSKEFIGDLEEQRISPQKFFKGHLDVLNKLYENAGINLRYSMEDIVALPGIDVTGVKHIHKKGIKINPDTLIEYPRYQDTTWVLTSHSNSTEYPRYIDYLTKGGEGGAVVDINGIPIDTGLIHELIHHTGIGDLYRSNVDFDENTHPAFSGFRVDTNGYMGSGVKKEISPIEAYFIKKLIENGTYSPQHDGNEAAIRIGGKRYYNYCPQFLGFKVVDSNNNPIKVHGVYTYAHKQGETRQKAVSGGMAMHPYPDQPNFIRQTWASKREELRQQEDIDAKVIQISAREWVILPIDDHTIALMDFLHGHPEEVDVQVRVNRKAIELMQKMNFQSYKDILCFNIVEWGEGESYPETLEGKVVYATVKIGNGYTGVYYFENATGLNMFEK